jgi:hypothetical protein
LHTPRSLYRRVPFGHRLLNGQSAFHSVNYARELGQNAVTRRVDDATTVRGDHREDHGLVCLEIAHRGLLSGAH